MGPRRINTSSLVHLFVLTHWFNSVYSRAESEGAVGCVRRGLLRAGGAGEGNARGCAAAILRQRPTTGAKAARPALLRAVLVSSTRSGRR